MPIVHGPAQTAFLDAVGNDRRGVMSERDARRLLDAALDEIRAAADPVTAYDGNTRFFEAARALVGRDPDAAHVLDSYERKGQGAVEARLAELGSPRLPPRLEARLRAVLEGDAALDRGAPLPITNIHGSPEEGYRFRYEIRSGVHRAHALPYADDYVLAPERVPARTLDAATKAMRAYFDEHFAPDLLRGGYETPESVARIRAQIVPTRAKLPDEVADPEGLVDRFPLVFVMYNATGSDHGYFVGSDLRGRSQEAYAFN